MDDDVTVDDGVPVHASPQRRRAPTWMFVLTGTLVMVLLLAGAVLSYFATAFSVMCTDDFDPSDCGETQLRAAMPIVSALLGAVAWCVGWARRRTPVGTGWAWGGVAIALVGLVVAFG
ncbi:hypothetical protein [Actinotalea subterranea]|uniref:hypothetical protein n=1 Tax=Actinotalea subterranea TaxID=2607497 RepID=UPI0011ECEE39|nr:hypothetical protein [Actinotalea subterranea]